MYDNKVITKEGRPSYKTAKDMKIKVTVRLLGRKDTTVTIKVPQESIADMLREDCFTDIANKASAKTGGRTQYGYIRKIEDKDY